MENLVLIVGIILALVLVLLVFGILGYVKAPPNQAYIISGFRKSRMLVGRSGIRIPFLERLDKLTLAMMSVDVKTTDFVPTNDFINVKADAAVKVKISRNEDLVKLASENFLNKTEDYIIEQVRDVLEGNMREIIGQMELKDMVNDRKMFADKVQENAVPDFAKMGLEIVAFNVQSFEDQNGIIDDLGIDNIAQIKKNASIAKANAQREIAEAESNASKLANDARVEAEKEIAVKNNQLAISKAELKREEDLKQAIADAAYEIEKENQRKRIELTKAEANIVRQQKESEVKEQDVRVKEMTLNAEIRKQAEADRYAKEEAAQAVLFERQKEAEAERYQREQEALALKAQADANKYAQEQEAAGIRAKGLAEAAAIQAKLQAEADGLDKKAEAMKKYGEAAVLEMYFKALPEVAKHIAEPLNNVDKITMYGEGNNAKMIEDITTSITKINSGLGDSMGIDLKSLLAGVLGGKILLDNQGTPGDSTELGEN